MLTRCKNNTVYATTQQKHNQEVTIFLFNRKYSTSILLIIKAAKSRNDATDESRNYAQ